MPQKQQQQKPALQPANASPTHKKDQTAQRTINRTRTPGAPIARAHTHTERGAGIIFPHTTHSAARTHTVRQHSTDTTRTAREPQHLSDAAAHRARTPHTTAPSNSISFYKTESVSPAHQRTTRTRSSNDKHTHALTDKAARHRVPRSATHTSSR